MESMTATLTLDEKEVKMLAWLAGFGEANIAQAIFGKLTKEYQASEWRELWTSMRQEMDAQCKVFSDSRSVFLGHKKAVDNLTSQSG